MNTILRNLNEGVVAVDTEERVQSINPTMEKLLNIPHKSATGIRLSSIVDLGLQETLRTGMGKLNQIQKIGFRTIVASRIPIFEQGVQTGAVFTCQDSKVIQQADRNLRSQSKVRNVTAKYELSQILGTSAAIHRAKVLANQYAKANSTILITGETGTGKELFAQGIHNGSPRKNNPFVAINCAAFPESLLESELFGHEEGAFSGSKRGGKAGLFEAAHTGTIFLDEIGDMPFPLQTRLLRVLQEKEILRVGSNEPMQVDIRVIAATNRNLKKSVTDGNFREDLFYRLNILCINLPPLRERIDDLKII
ncbi:MAG TPA: sigma 54-interacting transcriptional regulator, partial [Acidobacteriota bacterium]